jgi:hypothetical protein
VHVRFGRGSEETCFQQRALLLPYLNRGSGFDAEAIPEKSAQKIFRAADQIIRAGRAENHPVAV